MVGWHHRLNRYEFEQAPGVGVMDREAWRSWSRRVEHDLATEQQEQESASPQKEAVTPLKP